MVADFLSREGYELRGCGSPRSATREGDRRRAARCVSRSSSYDKHLCLVPVIGGEKDKRETGWLNNVEKLFETKTI